MTDIKDNLFKLCCADAVSYVSDGRDIAKEILSAYCETEYGKGLTVFGFLKGESDYTVMLDAHIDQVAFTVTNIDKNGFLTVSNAGGIDLRALPSRRVTVHTKNGGAPAVFCAIPPHLSSGETVFDDINKLKIDSLLGSKAEKIISLGDIVTFAGSPKMLSQNRVSAKSLDDRVGVACLVEVAKRLKGKTLPVNVAFVLSDGEELGLRGVRPAAFKVNPDEAIAVDVTFGDGIGIAGDECGCLGKGAMIGAAPCLDGKISSQLESLAKQKGIPYGIEVMGEKTGTDADMIAVTREGVRACTLSVPLRNMHTDCEIVDLRDMEACVSLLCEYILSGGVANA